MHIKKALAAYRSQKTGAKERRIEFKLTFQEWLDWWGDDIDRRGRGVNQLQMQRRDDTGPYELGNISKGAPLQNRITARSGPSMLNRAMILMDETPTIDRSVWKRFRAVEPPPDSPPPDFEWDMGMRSTWANI